MAVREGVEQIRDRGNAERERVEAVLSSSGEMSEVATMLVEMTGELDTISSRIQVGIDGVGGAARNIDSALSEQRASCEETRGNLDSLDERVHSGRNAINEADTAVHDLLRSAEALRLAVSDFKLTPTAPPVEDPRSNTQQGAGDS